MWIAEFKDYKSFLKAHIRTFPKNGFGQSSRLAEHLGVAPIVVSQILNKDRHFTQEQAIKTASFFGLDERSAEFFLLLVNHARADSKELKAHYLKKLNRLREESQNVKNIVVGKEHLSDNDKGIFYSNWYYSGVRLLSSIEGYQSVEQISAALGISRGKVAEIAAFLLATGLCVEDKGKIRMGTQSTHVAADNPFVNSHRRNWRLKGLEKLNEAGPMDLFYTSPVSLSEKDADHLKKDFLNFIKTFSKKVSESTPEEKLMCINIDWFEIA